VARPVYSAMLGRLYQPPSEVETNLVAASETNILVVRNMTAAYSWNPVNPPEEIVGFEVYDALGCGLWMESGSVFGTGKTLHWEGREVLELGDYLTVVPVGGQWTFRVSGYVLTPPT